MPTIPCNSGPTSDQTCQNAQVSVNANVSSYPYTLAFRFYGSFDLSIPIRWSALAICLSSLTWLGIAHGSVYCHEEGVRLEVLGSGELALDNVRAAGSYLIWVNDKARVLVNGGPGTYLRYKHSGANFNDLKAIVITQTGLEQTADVPSILIASLHSERVEQLVLFGPAGNDRHPATTELFDRLAGENGAFPELASFFGRSSPAGYRIRVRDVEPIGRKRWSQFATDELKLSAITVRSGEIPSLAWRVDVGEKRLVFAGEFNNSKDIVAEFANNANALVVSHRLPSGARGLPLDYYVTPEVIGRVAATANVEHVMLGSRGWRTFGRENATQETIAASYTGHQLYANEEECWGM